MDTDYNNSPTGEDQMLTIVQKEYPDLLYRILQRFGWESLDVAAKADMLTSYSWFIFDWYFMRENPVPEDMEEVIKHAFAWGEEDETEEMEIEQREKTKQMKVVIEKKGLTWATDILAEIEPSDLYMDHLFVHHMCVDHDFVLPEDPEALMRLYAAWLFNQARQEFGGAANE